MAAPVAEARPRCFPPCRTLRSKVGKEPSSVIRSPILRAFGEDYGELTRLVVEPARPEVDRTDESS
jgi:hypothetical protein